ncbi:MAG: 23S rRNA (pseudouridine(1915)-N(3))-methyltransferase RlmH [Pyrinomonadaceae bacterium]
MRVRLIWIGKTRDANLRALAEEYLKRLTRFTRCEVTELAAPRARTERECKEDEGRRICEALRPDTLTVLLDVEGRAWSSQELAGEVEKWQDSGVKEAAFIIGGAYGVSMKVRERANVVWSLSRLTLTHEMARVVLLEQIYRAYTIIHGLPYQK